MSGNFVTGTRHTRDAHKREQSSGFDLVDVHPFGCLWITLLPNALVGDVPGLIVNILLDIQRTCADNMLSFWTLKWLKNKMALPHSRLDPPHQVATAMNMRATALMITGCDGQTLTMCSSLASANATCCATWNRIPNAVFLMVRLKPLSLPSCISNRDADTIMNFSEEAVNSVVDAYLPIVSKHKDDVFTQAQSEWQQMRRGRYVEFNLVYDRCVQLTVRR